MRKIWTPDEIETIRIKLNESNQLMNRHAYSHVILMKTLNVISMVSAQLIEAIFSHLAIMKSSTYNEMPN